MSPIVELHGVVKTFRIPSVKRETLRDHVLGLFRPRRFETLRVLDGIDLSIERGETLGIMGRNGSGKSTLLKILCGIYPPSAGSVAVRATLTPVLELGIGWNPELDAVDNVYLLASVMGLSLREIGATLDEILAFAGLERFARLPLKHYSSGMAARLAYAVALHTVREVLVLDEVFAVGDTGFRARCEERFRHIVRAGHTVLLVSHDARAIATFCTRAILIEGGRVLRSGPADEVAAAYLELMARA